MEYRELGRSGIKVSRLCLGTMTFGQQNSEAEGHAQMDYAFARGINIFDAAEIYPVPPKPEKKPRAPRKKLPRLADGDYELPPVELLDLPRVREVRAEEESIQANAKTLEQTLSNFRVEAHVVGYTQGPVVTMFELSLAAGIKASKIHSLSDDLAIALKAPVRVVAPLPGKSTVGIEIPN